MPAIACPSRSCKACEAIRRIRELSLRLIASTLNPLSTEPILTKVYLMSSNPYSTPTGMFNSDGGNTEFARSKVAAPAIALLVEGIIFVLLAIWGVVMAALSLAGLNPLVNSQREQFEQMQQQNGAPAGASEFLETMMKMSETMQGPLGLVLNLIPLTIAFVVIFGALRMKNLRSYSLALASAILGMIPCFSPCCLVGLPIGVWAIVVLMDPTVKQSFR